VPIAAKRFLAKSGWSAPAPPQAALAFLMAASAFAIASPILLGLGGRGGSQ
jgi:hypothetical protein